MPPPTEPAAPVIEDDTRQVDELNAVADVSALDVDFFSGKIDVDLLCNICAMVWNLTNVPPTLRRITDLDLGEHIVVRKSSLLNSSMKALNSYPRCARVQSSFP
jgi:hypothetical protein